MTISVLEVVKRALRLCGQTGAPGRGIASEQQEEVINFLNQMIDGWNTLRGSIYTESIDRYALTPSQTSYFIGPTGDWVAPRPITIDHANLVLTNVSPEPHLPLRIFTDEEWETMVITEIPTAIPTGIYNDGASPDSKIYFWGYPTQAYDVELFTPSALPHEVTATDTFYLPDGYPRAIVYNLAVEIAPLYPKKALPGTWEKVVQIARKSRADISNANQLTPKLLSDAAFIGSRDRSWDYYSYLTRNL